MHIIIFSSSSGSKSSSSFIPTGGSPSGTGASRCISRTAHTLQIRKTKPFATELIQSNGPPGQMALANTPKPDILTSTAHKGVCFKGRKLDFRNWEIRNLFRNDESVNIVQPTTNSDCSGSRHTCFCSHGRMWRQRGG